MIDPMHHAESRNPLETMLRQVPGFKGYLEKEYRRESDQLARTRLADRLQQCKVGLDAWQRSLVDRGQLDQLPPADRLRSHVDRLQARIRGAMRGYSGFFDLVRVDQQLLDQVYELDMGLLDDAEALVRSADFRADESPQTMFDRVGRQLAELERRFDARHELLEGLRYRP